MTSVSSSLPAPALQAARAALSAAMSELRSEEQGSSMAQKTSLDDSESGEIQEVDMESQAAGIKTVFSDPTNFNVKHPLYSPWTLWFDSPSTKGRNLPQTPISAFPSTPQTPVSAAAQGWMEDIKKVVTFDSVEEFWGLYNNLVPPRNLPMKANYYLFKEGIIPAWEDEANKNGGKWSVQFPRDKSSKSIDKWWLDTMLAAIGETFDPFLNASDEGEQPPSLITGVILSSRPSFYRVSIWTRQAASEDDKLRERIVGIGKHFKISVLGFGETQKLSAGSIQNNLATEVEFQSHKDSEKKGNKGARKIVL